MNSRTASVISAIGERAAEYQLAKRDPKAFVEFQKMRLKIGLVIMAFVILLFVAFVIYGAVSVHQKNNHNKLLAKIWKS